MDGKKSNNPLFYMLKRPAWAIAIGILLLIILTILVIGPQRAYGAVTHIFGYAPGVGINDQSSPQKTVPDTPSKANTETSFNFNTAVNTPAQAEMTEEPQVVSVDKIIETKDGYILLGSVRPHLREGERLQITGIATIRDVVGKKVAYSFPSDVRPSNNPSYTQGGFGWVMQFKDAGVKFPLTISFPGVILYPLDPQASAHISIDVGSDPQLNQVWQADQSVELAGFPIRLVSVSVLADGYSFRIDPGRLSQVSVEINGVKASGGSGGGASRGEFATSMIYQNPPKGVLDIRLFNPVSAGPSTTWQVEWQPERPRAFTTAGGKNQACYNANTFTTIKPLPKGLDGQVIYTQLNPQIKIILSTLDGSEKEVVAFGKSRAALTLDGKRLAYTYQNGIEIQELRGGNPATLPDITGRDLHWSPDGTRLAYVNSGKSSGIFIIDADGKNKKQITNLGYESIAGWSPDGSALYYAIPAATKDGFLLRSADVNSVETQDVFVLENSSRKEPMPALSPDGKSIAYRASDNSSLYIKPMDGQPARLILDNPAIAIDGIVWEKEGHLLGVSLVTGENDEGVMILMQVDNCETYRLPGLSGELDGIIIP